MRMHLNRQIALVTGGSKGLGRAFARALADASAQVAVTARHEGELNNTVAEIEERGGRGFAFPADVTDSEAVARLVAAVEETLGPVDLLVNNAGSFRAFGSLAEVDPGEWWREVEINLRGPFLCARAVLPGMIERKKGRIINVASFAGLVPIETISAYCVSKAALIRLSEQLALETQEPGGERLRHPPRYGLYPDERLRSRFRTSRAAGAGGAGVVSAALRRGSRYAGGGAREAAARAGFGTC
jgi:NAD(P)-dependent dehydrogenase (short-subunit alcohol dehydrogenase family)